MDISSARLTLLLKEAMTPQAMPSAQADPVKTALVKALIQPPLPPLRSQQAASALATLPAQADKPQQLASAQIESAYLAMIETRGDTSAEAVFASAAARKPVPQGDETQRGLAIPAVKVEDTSATKPVAPSWFALVASEVSTARRAPVTKARARQGLAADQSEGKAEQSLQHWPETTGFASMAIGLIAIGIIAFAWLVLR